MWLEARLCGECEIERDEVSSSSAGDDHSASNASLTPDGDQLGFRHRQVRYFTPRSYCFAFVEIN
jgi:hypothetical protein